MNNIKKSQIIIGYTQYIFYYHLSYIYRGAGKREKWRDYKFCNRKRNRFVTELYDGEEEYSYFLESVWILFQVQLPTRYESVGCDDCRFIGTKEFSICDILNCFIHKANSGLFIPNENRLHSLSMQASFHALVSTILARTKSVKMVKRASNKLKSIT